MEEDEPLRLTGLDVALVGTALVWQRIPRGGGAERVPTHIYAGPVLLQLFQQQGMTLEEAHEHISYNVEGAYVGPATPIIMWPPE
jgi:hypothetical protein